MKIRSVGAELFRADGQTDRREEYFNWNHPDVFSLKYSRVSSVKRQLILLSITKFATCFDS